MASPGQRRRPDAPTFAPTSLTEITRRYYATAMALAKAMGLPLTETFLRDYRESISTCFIESSRAGVRLPPAAKLPPLGVDAPITVSDGQMNPPDAVIVEASVASPNGEPPAGDVPDFAPPTDQTPPPLTIPAGLPCAGQTVTTLKPAQLRMLLSKVDQLAAEQGSDWRPLLKALAAERATRLQAGRRPKLVAVEGDGHGA